MFGRAVVVFCGIVLFPHSVVGAQQPAGAQYAAVDSLLGTWTGDEDPGIAVSIVRDGETVWLGGRGLANLEHGIPVGPDTRFHLISGSKQFTAYAVTMLEEQGLLSVDDDVRRYLPELPDYGDRITLRHLLNHTSGVRQSTILQNYTVQPGVEYLTQERSLQLIFDQQALNFTPGTKATYSDSGYALLSRVIERLTERPFAEWITDNVFVPLGMTSTSVVTRYDELVQNRAEPYVRASEGWVRGGAWTMTTYGGTGVHSTTRDLARWVTFLASPEAESAVATMEERGVLANGDTIVFGRGLFVDEGPKGVRVVYHTGDASGFHAWIGRYPDLGLGIVVLTNGDPYSPTRIAQDIAALLHQDAVWHDPPPADPAAAVPVDSSRLARYAGRYRVALGDHGAVPTWVFRHEDGALVLNGGDRPLIPLSDSVYGMPEAPVTVIFHEGEDGRVAGLTVSDPLRDWSGVRYTDLDYEATPEELSALLGSYYSPEIDATYAIENRDGQLFIAHLEEDVHRQRTPRPLFVLAPDLLHARWDYFDEVHVVRGDDGGIIGLRVTAENQRVARLWFERR